MDSQLTYLPGLACLNFPNTIQPIAEKLPPSLRGKWEKEIAKYSICKDDRHIALLHKERSSRSAASTEIVDTRCTLACRPIEGGVSCSKLLLVDVKSMEKPNTLHGIYAIVDEQSNSSLISSELADELGAVGPEEKYYLTTCSGEKELKYGRRVAGVTIQSLNGETSDLPTLIECNSIPHDKREIPTPEMARRFPHLHEIVREIPPLDPNADIHLLLGRDAPELLKVWEFKNGPKGAPWAQKLSLGWTIIGQMCLYIVGGPAHVLACRTSLLSANNREPWEKHMEPARYELVPCLNQFRIKESFSERREDPENDIFRTTRKDNDISLSCEDRKFIEIMEAGLNKNNSGNWEMPLPFRHKDTKMPNNRSQAVNRLNGLIRTLRKKPQMEKDYLEFMQKILNKGHASPVQPSNTQSGRVWYLPHFGVYHPKKPTQIRVVFDSSAEFGGVSLNKELLPGPDLMNSLLGVLICFRKETTAVMCDIEQMFHSFHMDPGHRNFLRFLWFEDNTPGKPITEYRMNVHLFGNGPSPAVATFGLRRTAADGEEKFGTEAAQFVHRNFYVDDGLASLPTGEQAITLIKTTQAMLATANLRLHKIVSNSVEVMEAFPTEDRGKGVRDLNLHRDSLPAQRSLGVYWDLEKDNFTFQVSPPDKPFTRRGVLSIVNSVYDPLGLAVPVLLEGRLLLQQLVAMGKKTNENRPLGWDDPLPDALLTQWQRWRTSLNELEKVSVPRCYRPVDFGTVVRREIHAFSDASENAIGAAIYLRQVDSKGKVCTALLLGQSKVAPLQTTSIPRLELCAAVLAAQAVVKVTKEIDMEIDGITFYTDSKVVLGYIQNESRRFYVYVANRVQLIRKVSSPSQWRYVDTSENPADLTTRRLNAQSLAASDWLTGPRFLQDETAAKDGEQEEIPINEDDPEVRKEVSIYSTQTNKRHGLGADRFSRFSSLSSLQRTIANLIVLVKELKRRRFETQETRERKPVTTKTELRLRNPTLKLQQAMTVIIQTVQEEAFGEELKLHCRVHVSGEESYRERISKKKSEMKKSAPYRLDPFVDDNGILRVGGRLRCARLEYKEKHPALLPKGHHVSKLIVRHYHSQVHHQGRQITHGAIRQAGYWLVDGNHVVAKELSLCVLCKKLRGPRLEQRMADLPADRVVAPPPFTNVGFDVFGPWLIQSRKTRGGTTSSKRWGLVFTCLSSRAVHIEVLESMDTSSFICALRRFFALRGPASLLRCDRGTNFIGGKSELDEAMKEMDQRRLERYVKDQGCEWLFNPPYASHFSGAWEQQIGTIRRVLDAMFLELGGSQLTHELLVTLMAEVMAIVNARPITTVLSDTDEPEPLSPSMLLTMKTRPLGPPPGEFLPVDLYSRRRWRRVQYLADQFWLRWRREYMQTLQIRSKWNSSKRNLNAGDIVLVKEDGAHRNDWPLGLISEAIKSEDGAVRKAQVLLWRDGKKKTFLRPIKELVLLVPVQADGMQPTEH